MRALSCLVRPTKTEDEHRGRSRTSEGFTASQMLGFNQCGVGNAAGRATLGPPRSYAALEYVSLFSDLAPVDQHKVGRFLLTASIIGGYEHLV